MTSGRHPPNDPGAVSHEEIGWSGFDDDADDGAYPPTADHELNSSWEGGTGEGPAFATTPALRDDHYLGRSGGWGRRILVGVVVAGVAVVAAAVSGVFWVNSHLGGRGGAPVVVRLPDGADHSALTRALTRAGVVGDAWLFRRYVDYRTTAPVPGGTYTFHTHEGYRHAMHDLALGPKISQVRLTIPEGYGLAQIAASVGKLPGLAADRFLALAQGGAVRSQFEPAGVNSLEGLLFPDTYFVNEGENEQAILQAMVDRFDRVATGLNLGNSAQLNGLSPYETIVAASLIEKEAKIDADRSKISRVILNRLGKGMRLQIDATIEYAEGVHKDKLLNSDLKTPSPYNTYQIPGLPPGPIASPGRASLGAALAPATGSWLYYRLINTDGTHGFATTPAELAALNAEATAKGL